MERKRIVHRLDTPYSAIEWPVISQDDQDVILELLCRLLTPIGLHRKSCITPSKGKRKRQQEAGNKSQVNDAGPSPPPIPEVSAYVDVGLSSISRNLQDMVPQSKLDSPLESAAAPPTAKGGSRASKPLPYSVVFVARSGQSSAFHCHFPQMVALASKSQPSEKTVRLVGLSKPCEDRLSAALGIPRVSSIALRDDAPQAKGLVDFVRGHVAPVEVAWLEQARSGQYLETNIEGVATKIGPKKAKT